ncbi:MAG: DNA polymerase [Candidatus Bruticola sp.]
MNSKSNNTKKLLLIDGNGLAYRAFYALPARKSELGFPLNAILGFINLVINTIVSERPTHVAVAFDHGALVDTLMKFQTYNVQRGEMLDDLELQLPIIEDFVHICGIKAYRLPGFEADDCIGTLAAKANCDGFETLIISGDLGLMQLVSPHIKVMTMRRGIVDSVIFDEELVVKKYGLHPSQLADLRALAGDSSQNIGGVPGIGEVTARRLLSQYNSLTELFDSLDHLPAKWRNPLSENRDDAFEFLSRSTIRCDLPLEINWDECEFKGFPVQMTKRIFEQTNLEGAEVFLRAMGKDVAVESPCAIPEEALHGKAALEALDKVKNSSSDAAFVWFQNDKEKEPWGLSICLKGEHPVYIDLSGWHIEVPSEEEAPSVEEVWARLRPVFSDVNRVKYVVGVHEIMKNKADMNNVRDILLFSALLDINVWEHSIEAICARYGFAIYDRNLILGLAYDSLADIPMRGRICWTARIADVLIALGEKMYSKVEAKHLVGIYETIELPLARMNWRLNNFGLGCDKELTQKIIDFIDVKLKEARDEFFAEADVPEFDLDSEDELSHYLFNHLALLVPTRPKNGSILNAEMLKSLQDQNPIVEKIRCYCELSEFKRTFVQKFMVEGKTDIKIGGHLFNLALVSERRLQILGRVTSRGITELMEHMMAVIDNLACVSVRRTLAKAMDDFLRPKGNSLLIYLRFPAMGLRFLAHLAKDKTLTEDLQSGRDVEMELMKKVFGSELNSFISVRYLFVNMLLFCFSPAWLARRLGLEGDDSLQRASAYLNKFDSVLAETYPTSWNFILRSQAKATAMEEINTLAGRVCRLVEAGSRNYSIRENGERFARAFPIEGGCMDILRLALVKIFESFGTEVYTMSCKNMIIVHAPVGRENEIAEKCRQLCLEAAGDVPLRVEYRIH